MAKAKGKKKTEVLDYGAQVRSLREQGPGRLYLLWGREDYLREQYLLELKKLCLPGGEDDFSYHRFDGAELDFQALADAVDAVPFLTERTLIEVRGFTHAVNVGADRLRFLAPVRVGSKIRGVGEIVAVEEIKGAIQSVRLTSSAKSPEMPNTLRF